MTIIETIVMPKGFELEEIPFRDPFGRIQILRNEPGCEIAFMVFELEKGVYHYGPCIRSIGFCDWVRDGNDPDEYTGDNYLSISFDYTLELLEIEERINQRRLPWYRKLLTWLRK